MTWCRAQKYNARGQVTYITDTADIGNNRTYGYDDLSRLESTTGPWGSGSFTYDALTNIRAKTLGSRTVSVSYDTATNRATQSTDTAGPTRSIGYDARGNVTTLGDMTFVYDMSDQPVSQSGSVAATYTYDGNLKRAKQVIAGKTIYSVYDVCVANSYFSHNSGQIHSRGIYLLRCRGHARSCYSVHPPDRQSDRSGRCPCCYC